MNFVRNDDAVTCFVGQPCKEQTTSQSLHESEEGFADPLVQKARKLVRKDYCVVRVHSFVLVARVVTQHIVVRQWVNCYDYCCLTMGPTAA